MRGRQAETLTSGAKNTLLPFRERARIWYLASLPQPPPPGKGKRKIHHEAEEIKQGAPRQAAQGKSQYFLIYGRNRYEQKQDMGASLMKEPPLTSSTT